jgi:type IV pilus assembly protein PilC
MPTFHYVAIEAATGRPRTGELDRADANAAIADLKGRGLFPTELAPVPGAGDARAETARPVSRRRFGAVVPARFRRAAGAKELAVFARQLSALAGAGMPLVRGLDLLARQASRPAWQAVIHGLADGIRAGGMFSDELARHPAIFDRLFVGMVRAGESSGTLGVTLDRLALHLEKAARIKARVKSALAYPVIILIVAGTIVAGLVTLVIPRFEKIFAGVLRGAPLPALTEVVIGASRFVQRHGLLLLAAAVAGAAGARWLLRTETGARLRDRWLLRLPGIGGLLVKAAAGQFAGSLGTMLASGVPILQALQLTRDASGNRVVAAGIDQVRRRVREGEGIARPLAAAGTFPPLLAGMVEVGEETGTLPAMLGRVADLYDEEVDRAVTSLTSLLEPVMVVLMAVIVGTIVIALFLPIIRIIQLLT